MTYLPDGATTIVVLTNLGGAKPAAIANELIKKIGD
jgi:hypothetical protein